MKDNKEFIKEVYDKYERYEQEKYITSKKSSMQKYNLKVKILTMVALVLVIFSFIIINNKNIYKDENVSEDMVENISLSTIDNFENFYQIIKNTNLTTNQNRYDIIKRS